MSRRTFFIDEGLGEVRGGILLDGRPERLLIQRADDNPRLALGARLRARVAHVEPALAMAFLDLGEGAEATVWRWRSGRSRGSASSPPPD